MNASHMRLVESQAPQSEPVRMFAHPDNKSLAKILAGVALAMSKDDTRPHLCAMLIEADSSGRAVFVATDGHRLHKATLPVDGSGGPATAIITAEGAKALIKSLRAAPKGSPVTFACTSSLVAVQVGDGQFIHYGQTGDTFPPYEKVIPRGREHESRTNFVGAHARYLVDAFKACESVTVAGNLVLDLGDELDPILIEAESPDIGSVTCVVMPVRT